MSKRGIRVITASPASVTPMYAPSAKLSVPMT